MSQHCKTDQTRDILGPLSPPIGGPLVVTRTTPMFSLRRHSHGSSAGGLGRRARERSSSTPTVAWFGLRPSASARRRRTDGRRLFSGTAINMQCREAHGTKSLQGCACEGACVMLRKVARAYALRSQGHLRCEHCERMSNTVCSRRAYAAPRPHRTTAAAKQQSDDIIVPGRNRRALAEVLRNTRE